MMKHKKISQKELKYVSLVLMHVDTLNVAALYAEALINNYPGDLSKLIVDELSRRDGCLEILKSLLVGLYQHGICEAWVPLQLEVVNNFLQRNDGGNPQDIVKILMENGNMKNSVKIIAANCDWLPGELITDELLETVVENMRTF